MPYGSGQAIRQAMMYAKPWQRYVIGCVMIVGGAALVAVGHVAGGILAAAGALLLWRMFRYRLLSRHQTRRGLDPMEAARQ